MEKEQCFLEHSEDFPLARDCSFNFLQLLLPIGFELGEFRRTRTIKYGSQLLSNYN